MDLAPISSDACVLVVDEDPETRDALRLLFEFENFRVIEASSAAEVLTRLLRCSPEVVVFRGAQPDPSLRRALSTIRHLMPEARVVACSATLEVKPSWADAFLNRARLIDVSPVLSSLVMRGVV